MILNSKNYNLFQWIIMKKLLKLSKLSKKPFVSIWGSIQIFNSFNSFNSFQREMTQQNQIQGLKYNGAYHLTPFLIPDSIKI